MKAIETLKGKHVLVLGLAKSGEAAARLLKKLGAKVTINDAKPLQDHTQAQALMEEGFRVICGEHPLSLLDESVTLIVKNPGIPYSNVLIKEAENRNINVITEIELAYQISEAEIIAITGSNGKTTTTTLIYEMLKSSAREPLIAGNIGTVACEVAEQAQSNQVIVMEVSSFQLLGVDQFKPRVSVLLNLFEAHLDYHGTLGEYHKAKAAIFKNQDDDDQLVYNLDDQKVVQLVKENRATGIPFTQHTYLDQGVCLFEGTIYYDGKQIINANEIVLPGSHNMENILAAIGTSMLMGAEISQIQHVLKTFNGVKHRLQFVKELQGRSFYNDSKATNILATVKALQSFQKPTLLLAGGLDRGNSFEELIPYLTNVRAIVTFGQTADKLKETAQKAGIELIMTAVDVIDGVHKAWQISNQNDVILLSPACASWDQYPTFEVRGQKFIDAVESL
ncbi:UDP-N-acetylmuramoyl-L-alanine--D-glutamate ligase [Alkalihalobacillus trypoxylicola]|uniref:UDP-N-acetylmuramoylalanine--D-glutamate ligase n=1 Tax=Alkalihalobacillus trypoxylicola TaxID=519424 RepID=A0A162FAS8_9BACI|nr:UDP-N-acetylmuramoyl-L-alanine--D-glutamate ligase [Alkalihalobacillus trypoxylicola]KYG35175.1 UDP-N-acetylmuramoyl-L-alanine--D-glutamate ligase [Alkalihalobacillus trypoxylicola]